VAVSQISSNNNAHQANDYQAGFGQLRNGFRHLLQFINDGNLAEAQRMYNDLSQTMPDVFEKLSSKLTHDYNSIGRALREENIPGAQQAVVQLKQDLQGIGSTGSIRRHDQTAASVLSPASTANNMIKSYHSGNIGAHYVGTIIDITI
jgi:hypothetical protein